jgi:hypothetical protein
MQAGAYHRVKMEHRKSLLRQQYTAARPADQSTQNPKIAPKQPFIHNIIRSIQSLDIKIHAHLFHHLRIKAFYGTSPNAVSTQIWIAISVYVLVAIVKKRLNLERSLHSILQILSLSLFEKTPILEALSGSECYEIDPIFCNQLNLFN